mmetsp:Transcript_53481/g.116753  ORF Transcript_53481/g.116753 Transcript_53481/m.116753 type:complete len:89 (+) Transcript_53481:37-303(+)|eukprot:CAMPEP_0116943996 /NCGR_PEP_ID=MMETSP0467-20121206/35527_1 /TAXON_ID=283647 /ORGANISM="Mesodinium pulex, Strain SPMC105" /LENGTH=88 /DNA_ID=CAMNT_0004627299 /DNA_START=204 /DNA_END=470 /DNA_ORIENTATION=+
MKDCGSSSKVVGVSVAITGTPEQNLIDLGYWTLDSAANMYRLNVVFRDLSDEDAICSDERLLGDRVVINPHSINETVPFTLEGAQQDG